MAIECAAFSFQAPTSNGVQTIVSGLSFTPKAYILFTVLNNSANTFENHHVLCIGMSDGTTSRCGSIMAEDGQATSDAGRAYSNTVIRVQSMVTPDTGVDGIASHSSFGAGSIAINWTDFPGSLASTFQFYGICWGGADLQAEVRSFTMGTTATGNADYTGVAFQPEVMFTMCPDSATALPFTTAHAAMGFGAAVSNTKRFLLSWNSEDAQADMDTWRLASSSKCVGCLVDTTGAYSARAFGDFVSWLSNGVRINWEIAPHSTTYQWWALFMAGGDWDIVKVAKRTSTGDTIISPTVNTIKGMLMASACIVDNDAANAAHARASIGVASATNTEFGVWTGDQDATAAGVTARRSTDTNILIMATENTTHTSSTIEAVANISAMSTTATLTYTTCTTLAADLFFVFCGEITATLYDRPISETSVSVSEALARVQIKVKPISETAVTISETLTRVQSLIKTISETSVTVSETLARIPTYLKPISETAISVNETLVKGLVYTKPINESAISINDTIVRIPLYLKPINETAITTNDSIARWISVSYTLAEPSITVNDSIQGALFYLRQISESAISVNDTIARILTAIRAISDPSISTNDTIARIQTLLKTISESAISVNDSVAKVPTFVKSISETAINTNDTIVRILAAVRTISDPSISVNDTITRIQTILKQISESAISVNDSLQAGLLLTISLVESRVKWYYSVLTRKITA